MSSHKKARKKTKIPQFTTQKHQKKHKNTGKKHKNTTHKHHSHTKILEKILKYQKIPFAHTKTPKKHKHHKISRAKTPLNSRKKNTVPTLLVTTKYQKKTRFLLHSSPQITEKTREGLKIRRGGKGRRMEDGGTRKARRPRKKIGWKRWVKSAVATPLAPSYLAPDASSTRVFHGIRGKVMGQDQHLRRHETNKYQKIPKALSIRC